MCAGEHGCGGRLGTRRTDDASLRHAPKHLREPPGLCFDHAAQFFTATDPWFQDLVSSWVGEGVSHPWHGSIAVVQAHGDKVVVAPHESKLKRFVASGGMRSLAEWLAGRLEAGGVEISRPCWVSSMNADESVGWRLGARSRRFSLDDNVYDFVVIAHNGKCANQLLRPAGVPAVAKQMRALQLSAVWVVMAAFQGALQPLGDWEGAFVNGMDALAWAGNNTKKLSHVSGDSAAKCSQLLVENIGEQVSLASALPQASQQSMECWTLISTAKYGVQNKVPQERVPPETSQQVRCQVS